MSDDVDELVEQIWEKHQDELWRKTIGIDIGFTRIVEIVVKEVNGNESDSSD